ncbi:MAG: hypothetical protein Q4E65_03985 [Clostridia bacterium]|nr:hypothetical protein [Clostridia bacterium]
MDRKRLRFMLALLFCTLILFCALPALAQDEPSFSGDGTREHPYLIDSADALIALRDAVNGGARFNGSHFLQTADLDMSGVVWTPIGVCDGESFFAGVYDGGGHAIRELHCDKADGSALFGVLGGSIRNLGIESSTFTGGSCASFACEAAYDAASIVNCYSRASLAGTRMGGVAGDFSGSIIGCWSDCTFFGDSFGGVAYACPRMIGCYTTANALDGADIRRSAALLDRETLDSPAFVKALNEDLDIYALAASVSPSALRLWQQTAAGAALSSTPAANAALFTGSGTALDPYRIHTPADLLSLSHAVNMGLAFRDTHLRQEADIDLSGTEWQPIGSLAENCYFFGTYDGGGHTIRNINCTDDDSCGFFGMLGGTVMNLGIESGSLSGSNYCGGIAGISGDANARILNCYSHASVSGNMAGGIAGMFAGRIANCYSTAIPQGHTTGGIVAMGNILYACYTPTDRIVDKAYTAVCFACRTDIRPSAFSDLVGDCNRSVPVMTFLEDLEDEPLHLWKAEGGRLRLSDKRASCTKLRGKGTEENPFLLETADELAFFRDIVNAGHAFYGEYILQEADIDLRSEPWTPIGIGKGACFYGTYDGGGHAIDNLLCEGYEASGFFSELGGTVMNLGIRSGSVSGERSGAIACTAGKPLGVAPMILNCYNRASVSGEYAGGIACSFAGRIAGCYSDCTLNATRGFGGICAYDAEEIAYCCSTAGIAPPSMAGVAKSVYTLDEATQGGQILRLLNGSVVHSAQRAKVSPDTFCAWTLQDGEVTLSETSFHSTPSSLLGLALLHKGSVVKLGALFAMLLLCLAALLLYCRIVRSRGGTPFSRLRKDARALIDAMYAKYGKLPFWLYLGLCLACAGFTLWLLFKLETPPREILAFAAFLLVYLLLPGYVLARKLHALDYGAAFYAFCGLGGMVILVASYLLSSLVRSPIPFYALPPCAALASLFLMWRDNRRGRLHLRALRPDLRTLCIVAFFTTLSFAIRAIDGASPALSGSVTMFADSVFIAENSAALINGLPAVRFDLPDYPFRYHLLSNLLQACAIRLTNISAVDVYMKFWSFCYLPLSICTLYTLCREYLGEGRKAWLCTLFALCGAHLSFGLFYILSGTNMVHQHLDMRMSNVWVYLMFFPNGTDLAIPTILGTGLVALQAYRKKCGIACAAAGMFLLCFLTSSAKLPFGLCVVGALCGTMLLSLCQGKKLAELKTPLLLTIASIAALASAYFLFVYDPSPLNKASTAVLAFGDERNSVCASAIFKVVGGFFEKFGLFTGDTGRTVLSLLLTPAYLFALLPLSMPAFLLWVREQLKAFHAISLEHMFLCGVATCGLLANVLLAFDGISQLYFFLAAGLFVPLLGFGWLWERLPAMKNGWRAVCAFLLVASLFFPFEDTMQRIMQSKDAMRVINAHSDAVPEPMRDGLTAYEYEAMCWIRDNTPEDAVLAIDRFYLCDPEYDDVPRPAESENACFFYYGAYAQRHLLLGGWSYSSQAETMYERTTARLEVLDALYDPSTPDRAAIMREYGASYLVVSRIIHEDMFRYSDSLALLYANRDIAVYGLPEEA